MMEPLGLKLLCIRSPCLSYALFWQQMGNYDILLSGGVKRDSLRVFLLL